LFSQQDSAASDRPSRSTGTSFPLLAKYALALVSLIAFVAISLLGEHLESGGGFSESGFWLRLATGGAFGALVLGPYASGARRVPRVLALAAASAAIYYLAVRFVADGPIPYDSIVSLIVAGSGAALLCGLAVVFIAPRAFSWGLVPLLFAAGALGGAAFEVRIPNDELLLVGHAAWQLLVCVALHAGFRPAGLTSSSAS
jgi:hypothetical protein